MQDGRSTIRDIAKDVGISQLRVHFLLKYLMNVQRIPNISINDQERVRVRTAKQLLKTFLEFKTICKYCYLLPYTG